jgi:hypothetical protein
MLRPRGRRWIHDRASCVPLPVSGPKLHFCYSWVRSAGGDRPRERSVTVDRSLLLLLESGRDRDQGRAPVARAADGGEASTRCGIAPPRLTALRG